MFNLNPHVLFVILVQIISNISILVKKITSLKLLIVFLIKSQNNFFIFLGIKMFKRNHSFRQSMLWRSNSTLNTFEDFSNIEESKTTEDTEEISREETSYYNIDASDNCEEVNLDEKPNILIQLIQANGENLKKYTEEMDALYNEKNAMYWKTRKYKRQLLVILLNIKNLKTKIIEAEEKLKQYESEAV
jgi:hypothetical protein